MYTYYVRARRPQCPFVTIYFYFRVGGAQLNPYAYPHPLTVLYLFTRCVLFANKKKGLNELKPDLQLKNSYICGV